MLATLALVLISKKFFARPRPPVPSAARRMIDLRSKETNCSWPSGDAAQAALFACFVSYNFPYFGTALGTSALLKFIGMVSIGRVFHHCHFFGDTIGGAVMGFSVALFFNMSDVAVPVPQSWDEALANASASWRS